LQKNNSLGKYFCFPETVASGSGRFLLFDDVRFFCMPLHPDTIDNDVILKTPRKPMMDALLKHLVEITCHRDHTLLDASVISALHELAGAKQARILEVFKLRDDLLLRPRAWIKDGQAATIEEGAAEHAGVPITEFPALVHCIEQRKASAEETTADGIQVLWLPIWSNDKVSTCLEISSLMPYSHQTLPVIEGILSVYRNYQSLIDYSERDSLTNLYNRKTFDDQFSRMVSVAVPHESIDAGEERRQDGNAEAQWLAVVDIDHFKKVNDTFGHLYGDEVLILIANLLRSSFRAQDRIFRFGGEEFVVLLRATTLEDAIGIFERFRSNVEEYKFPQVGRVTVSLGFASINPRETPVVILGHADQALYHAKTNGRNRICHYDELVRTGVLRSEVSNNTAEFFFDEPNPD
jgi:diguanylate cyclase (GGDEF)-like protein